MMSKTVLAVCLQICLAQFAFSQVIRGVPLSVGNPNILLGQPSLINNLGPIGQVPCGGPILNDLGCGGLNPANFPASNGGAFIVSSSSPIAATGLSIVADNLVIDGAVAVTGKMPFLGAVSVDGCVPAAGQGAVVYNCGNDNVGIVSEGNLAGPAIAPGLNMGLNNLALNNLGGINRIGC